MNWLLEFLGILFDTVYDVLPIAGIIFGFQFLVIRRPLPDFKRLIIGFLYVLLGMALFLMGLEQALFPLGKVMAAQLTDPVFIRGGIDAVQSALTWRDYYWVYIFAAARRCGLLYPRTPGAVRHEGRR